MYYGFAISHELRTGFLYESDYASRSSVYENVERCLEAELMQPVVVAWESFECHTANAAEGMEERLEFLLADMVTGLPGLEEGYELYPKIIEVSKASREPVEQPEPERGAEAVRSIADAYGFEVRETSLRVWVSGDTRPHREELKAAGAKWSGKRQAWYWRKEQAA